MAFSLDVSLEHIRQGLRTFTNSFFQAPGRCNVFDEHPFRVIVDYGHNAAAMRKMAELVKSLHRKRAIGVIAAAGDRRDQDIAAMADVAADAFDLIVVKEDSDKRGREDGARRVPLPRRAVGRHPGLGRGEAAGPRSVARRGEHR